MPNIEIHTVDATDRLKSDIDTKMREISLGGEAITTVIGSRPQSCDGNYTHTPFLRVYSTDKSELNKVVKALKELKLDLDIETLMLNSFIPEIE